MVYFIVLITVLISVGVVNDHLRGVPGDLLGIALLAGLGAFIGVVCYLWCLVSVGLKLGVLKDGKPTPLLMQSAWIVFLCTVGCRWLTGPFSDDPTLVRRMHRVLSLYDLDNRVISIRLAVVRDCVAVGALATRSFAVTGGKVTQLNTISRARGMVGGAPIRTRPVLAAELRSRSMS